jgi:MoxR-like ATPase
VTVPEIGTFRPERPPIVIVTSNRSRELHDALKRRCFYHWIEFPSIERATEIVRRRVPDAAEPLANAATAFVARSRHLDLDKPAGLAETIDWVSALSTLGVSHLDRTIARSTLGAIAKTPDDLQLLGDNLDQELAG